MKEIRYFGQTQYNEMVEFMEWLAYGGIESVATFSVSDFKYLVEWDEPFLDLENK